MANAFSLTSVTDRTHSRIYMTATGELDSAGFVDAYIAETNKVREPWRYSRLIDLTTSTGHVAFDDFVRLSQYWAPLLHFATGPLKTAVVTHNPRTEGRMPVVSLLMEGHDIQTFADLPTAEAWLDRN